MYIVHCTTRVLARCRQRARTETILSKYCTVAGSRCSTGAQLVGSRQHACCIQHRQEGSTSSKAAQAARQHKQQAAQTARCKVADIANT
jgi:hypothetical protein